MYQSFCNPPFAAAIGAVMPCRGNYVGVFGGKAAKNTDISWLQSKDLGFA
jgi:hypothetical protein